MGCLVFIPIGGSLTSLVISIQAINRDYKICENINPFYQQLWDGGFIKCFSPSGEKMC